MNTRSNVVRQLCRPDLARHAIAIALLTLPFCVRAADADGDGFSDTVDNCIEVANADQRDTDADGYGNVCDADLSNNLVVNFGDVALFKGVFFKKADDEGFDPDADFDGNGFINFIDLSYLKKDFFTAPGPAGNDSEPVPGIGPLEIDTLATPEPICGDLTHHLRVDWKVPEPEDGLGIDITVLLPDGHSETRHSTVPTGAVVFDLNSQYGGPATVITTAGDRSGNTGRTTLVAELPPCDDNPPPVPPDLGFQGPPDEDPPIIGVPDAKPNEVDVVHLGGSPNGPARTKIVAAAGTGSGVKLYSYDVDPGSWKPMFMKEAGPFAGKDVKLEVLSPDLTPKLEVQPFVAGVIRTDGNLWLTPWQVFDDGSFMDFDSVGYGANAHVHVESYDIAHRQLDDGDYQIVTAVLTSGDRLRTITWEIDSATGDLTGRADSGDWGAPAPGAVPSIEHLNGNLYVVSFRDTNGRMATRYWDVSPGGTPKDAYGAVSGLDHYGEDDVAESIVATVNLPIATDGFLTPVIDAQGSMKLDTWETRFLSWGEGGVSYMPYLISDSTRDENPGGLGVAIAAPTPTDATSNGAFVANVRALLTDGLVEDDFGVGQGELFSEMPAGELTSISMASVTKNMTLLVAVEAIENGEVALDDVVEISADAANVGGSQMGMDSSSTTDDLQEGEKQTLETLLYGMMLRSGNDAAAAIAEHISGYGNFDDFVARMNQRASELGLEDTLYGETDSPAGAPAGGGISTPQDQITLWLHADQDPLFAQVASAKTWDACGEDADGNDRCYFLTKLSDSGYPGLAGWKGGNGGFSIDPDFDDYTQNGGPYCVGSGCLVAQATRLDRDMIVGIQQSGDRWGDADEMFEYGYRLRFTADHRGPKVLVTSVADFALDSVQDTLGVLARIDLAGKFDVCTWTLFADSGFQKQISCHRPRFTGVAGSVDRAPPTLVDGVRISTLLADGDYWTAYLNGSTLNFDLWRVGSNEP
jgi:hypothetical protein